MKRKFNTKLAYAILGYIATHPREHDQSTFGNRTTCGTSLCIAGTACLLSDDVRVGWAQWDFSTHRERLGEKGTLTVLTPTGRPSSKAVYDEARRVLGLSYEQANELFYNMNNRQALNQLQRLIRAAEKENA